jgi:integrase
MPPRSDGLYQRHGYHYFKWKDIEGNWHEQATRTRNYAEARLIRTRFLAQQALRLVPTERAKWTLQQAVDQRLIDRKHRIARSSLASETSIMRNLVRLLGSGTRLEKLADIDAIRRYETDRLQEGVSAKSVNNEVLVLAGVLRDAKLWRLVEPDYKPLPVKKSDIPDALTRDEAHRLLQVAKAAGEDSVAALVAVVAYATGMRSKEIKQLQLGSIRLDSGRPQVQVRRATTKTNKGVRFVALDSMACWAFGKLLSRAHRLGACQPGHYLLPTLLDRHTRPADPLKGGSGWDATHPQSSWEAEWDRVRTRAGIEHRRFHDLRHSYITRAAEAGVPLMVIQEQVGHMSVAMTRLYCHISQATVHKAARLIEEQNPDLLSTLGLPDVVDNTETSTSLKDSDNAREVLLRYENPKGVIQ